MAQQVAQYAIEHRQNSRSLTYLSRKCLSDIAERQRPGASLNLSYPPIMGGASGAVPPAGRRRGAGGDGPSIPQFEAPSQKQLASYALDTLHNGQLIVMEKRGAGKRHAVVPIEDLEAQMRAHSLPGLGINRLFHQMHNVTKVRLSDNPDGSVRWSAEGLSGFGKEAVKVFLADDPVAADRRPTAPAAQPELQPLVVNRINEHWQIDLFDNCSGNDPCIRYVCDIVDHHSKYLVAASPLVDKAAGGVLLVLYHTCCREGFPAIIQSDNGSEFCADVIRRFCKMFGIEHRRGSVGRPNVQGQVEKKNGSVQDALRALLMRCPGHTWGVMLPLALWHLNASPTAALGGRSPHWARYGVSPNVTALPPLEELFELLGFSSSLEAACLPNEMDLTPPQCEQRPAAAATAAAKKPAGKKRQREPSPDSSDEAEAAEAATATEVAQVLAELGGTGTPSAAAAAAAAAAASGQRRPRRPGAGSGLSAILAGLAVDDDGAEGAPTRKLPARQTALSSPSGSRRRLQQAARVFEQWAQPDEAAEAMAAAIPEDEVDAEPAWRTGHAAELTALNEKNRIRIRSQSRAKPGAKAKTWEIGDIVTYLPRSCGSTKGPGVAPKRVACKVVAATRRGGVVYYKLRSNEGVLRTEPRGAELDRAVPDTAATLKFDDVEVEGLPVVKETALARRGAGKSCSCRKQCGRNCSCKKRGAACSRSCGCKCKVGANCGNH